ncbi:MAG TPA: hypothetical protein VGQ57_21635, partial [Polyangiaceae bacterium]|nr:hypothetical protein [Polyangiaceae bacterium]
DPVNQCFADRPELESPGGEAPATSVEPAPPPSALPAATASGMAEGAGGAGGAGSEALVRRFTADATGGTEGAPGSAGAPGALPLATQSCVEPGLRVIASCVGFAHAAQGGLSPVLLATGLNCALAVVAHLNCEIVTGSH